MRLGSDTEQSEFLEKREQDGFLEVHAVRKMFVG